MEDKVLAILVEQEKIEIVLRDLDILLRKKFGDYLIVDSFTISSLVPLEEHYESSMTKVDAMVRRNGRRSEPEELFLVAKMTPPTNFQKRMFKSSLTFPKEIYMYERIVPAYKALEREYGIQEEEVFDTLPELYGARLSLNDQTKFDHDAVILMENLEVKNYYCGNRRTGVDLAHARLVVETLFSSCDRKVCDEHLNDLFDLYHEKFISHLARLKCDVRPFSKESFNEQLVIAGNLQYVHCLSIANIMSAEVNNELCTITPEIILHPQPTEAYIKRLAEVTLDFVKVNWI